MASLLMRISTPLIQPDYEEKYRTLFETMTQGVVYRDSQGKILTANPAALKIYGLSIEQILGKKPTDPTWKRIKEDGSIFPPEEHPALVALRTSKRQENVIMGVRNHNTRHYRWININAVPQFQNNEKKPYQVYTTFTDITDQKNIEKNLLFLTKASELLSSTLEYKQVLTNVVEAAVDDFSEWCAVYLFDDEKKLQQVASSHRCPKKKQLVLELEKQYPLAQFADKDVNSVIKTCKSQLYSQITTKELKRISHDQRHLELLEELGIQSMMIVPIIDQKKAIGAISFISAKDSERMYRTSDVSIAEQLASRVALAIKNATLYERTLKSEKIYDNLFHSNIIGVIQVDLHGKVLQANDEFLRIIGKTRDDLHQGTVRWDNLTPESWKEVDEKAVHEILHQGYVAPYEKEYISGNKNVPVLVGAALIDKKTTETIALVLDISESKKLEQRKDEFIGIASHELKTPLTTIKGYTQIIEKKIIGLKDKQLLSYVQKSDQYIDKLSDLIGDLLDVSKIQAGKLQLNKTEFVFADLVNEVADSIEHMYSSHEVIREIHVDTKVFADRQRVEQVLTNLLTNAIKYSPRAYRIVLNVVDDKDSIRVSVTDFGVGIAPKEQQKIFQRFYRSQTTEKSFSGLGIGLYISAEIIRRHEGEIWVRSEEKGGSTFFFTLPKVKGKHGQR